MGHTYTETYLQEQGWSTYTCPHATLQWEGGTGGWNDAYAAPNPETGKVEGGFDIIAVKPFIEYTVIGPFKSYEDRSKKEESRTVSHLEASLWQVKKTKANPFTPKFKREIRRCVEFYNLVPSTCFGIWWPNGHGPKGKPPIIWRSDE